MQRDVVRAHVLRPHCHLGHADTRSRVPTGSPHAKSLPLCKMAMASLALSAVRPTAGSILTYRPRKTELYLMLSGPSIKSSSSSATHDRILTCRAQAHYERRSVRGLSRQHARVQEVRTRFRRFKHHLNLANR